MTLPIPPELPADIRLRLAEIFARPAVEPEWTDSPDRSSVLSQLAVGPTVTTVTDVNSLQQHLASVAQGRTVLVQADCAYPFHRATARLTSTDVSTLGNVSMVVMAGAGVPVVLVGRLGGQYAFPIGHEAEHPNSLAYRHDAHRMLAMYANATATRNLVHSLGGAGFDDTLERWFGPQAAFLGRDAHLTSLAAQVQRNVRFLRTYRGKATLPALKIYAGHRATMLEYDAALLRDHDGRLYALSADSLWIGGPTGAADGAHVAFAAAVENPVSVILGPRTTPREAAEYTRLLAVDRPDGRLTFVCRMGATSIYRSLPQIVERVNGTGSQVLWLCDPTASDGTEERLAELAAFFEIHKALGSRPGGVHIGSTNTQLEPGQPRLDVEQSWEIALGLAELIHRNTPSMRPGQ